MRVAIAGGGLAGLAAGMALAEAKHDVELFERSRLLGGRATSFEIGGVEVDNGQHVFLGCCDAFIDFASRAGMKNALYLQERFEALVIDHGKASALRAGTLPAPWHLVASFLRFRHLGLGGKIDVARALAAASHNGNTREQSFASWLREQRQGDEAMRVFWTPFFVPALNVPLEEMDAREALFTLRTAFLQDAKGARFGFSKVPLAHIARAAAAQLSAVRTSTSVQSLKLAGNRAVTLETTSGERHAFDAFILALAPPQLMRLLGDPEHYGLASLDEYKPHPIIDVHLRYTCQPDVNFSFAALVDSRIQWVFRKGDGYLVCSMSAAGEYLRRSTDDLIELAWSEVRKALPKLRGATLEDAAVTRNPEATFSASAKTVRPGPATTIENVFIAGSWTGTGWPDTMESAVRSGITAAQRMIHSMSEMELTH
jgi:squalene-associated FAD-dependent desaturase